MAMEGTISVPEYYAGKTIFLTGATGFVGKMFLEKLLRSCPDVEAVYCLVRDKKGKSARERIEKLCHGQAFDVLRKANPGFPNKIHAVPGDLQEGATLGMAPWDIDFLLDHVHVVIHSAADVAFNQTLKNAVESNLIPTQHLSTLAKKMQKLESFVYISTAYSNCDRLGEILEEKIYEPSVEPSQVIDLIRLSDEEVESKTQDIIGAHPNTYTFTKNLAESMLAKETEAGLPLVIVRPTIIINAHREPMEGFIDQFSGFTYGMIGLARGFVSKWYTRPEVILDLVPVDHVVNAMIVGAWQRGVTHSNLSGDGSEGVKRKGDEKVDGGEGGPLIYHVSTSYDNPFTIQQLVDYGIVALDKFPFENGIGQIDHNVLTSNKFVFYLSMVFQHLPLGLFLDLILRIIGKKPMLFNIYMKMIKLVSILDYFSLNSWVWSTSNLRELQNTLSNEDRKLLPMDASSINWQSFIISGARGIKLYLLDEDLGDIGKVRRYYKRLRWSKLILKAVIICLILLLLYYLLSLWLWN